MTVPTGAADPPPQLLRASQLRKTFPGLPEPALNGIGLAVHPGEILGLLGPNGAGKTTALSILSGLLRPDSGEVSIGGFDLRKHPRRARECFGLAPQEIALYPDLTAAENLRFFGQLYGLTGTTLAERVEHALTFTGLADRAKQRVGTFSGGMKRRANLAAAILHRPRLVFLDEPTVGIDAQSRNLILERLERLAEAGTGMIYTTHYMEEAERLCTRIAVIDAGSIIAQGTSAELRAAHPEQENLGDLFLHLTGRNLRD